MTNQSQSDRGTYLFGRAASAPTESNAIICYFTSNLVKRYISKKYKGGGGIERLKLNEQLKQESKSNVLTRRSPVLCFETEQRESACLTQPLGEHFKKTRGKKSDSAPLDIIFNIQWYFSTEYAHLPLRASQLLTKVLKLLAIFSL